MYVEIPLELLQPHLPMSFRYYDVVLGIIKDKVPKREGNFIDLRKQVDQFCNKNDSQLKNWATIVLFG